MRILCGAAIAAWWVLASAAIFAARGEGGDFADWTQYVLSLMGSDNTREVSAGNTYPAVCRPNGMHLWSLQTGKNGEGHLYLYRDARIRGIRQTHQPSPWINDYNTWSFMPVTRNVLDQDGRASWFSHKEETFEPHRMKAYLADDGVTVELTATERAALARVTYPETETPYFIVDAYDNRGRVRLDKFSRRIWGDSRFVSKRRQALGAVPESFVNRFVLAFDRDFTEAGASGSIIRVKFAPMKRGETVTVKIASSFISDEQALHNLGELGDGDFDRLVEEGRAAWNERLGRIRVEGGSIDDLRKFYTCNSR